MSVSVARGSVSIFFAICFLTFFPACNSKKNKANNPIRRYVKTADSLSIAGKVDSAVKILQKQRRLFKRDDAEIAVYYNFMSHVNRINGRMATLYADSALAVFDDKDNIDKYPDDYYKTLLVKADAFIAQKQYANALEYYDKAQKYRAAVCYWQMQ